MRSQRDKDLLRRILLIVGLAIVVIPSIFSLTALFAVSSASSRAAQAHFWNVLAALIRGAFPIALIIGYLRKPRRLAGAYWLIPLYFGVLALAALVPVIRTLVMNPEAFTLSNLGVYTSTSVLLPLVYAVLLWVVRPPSTTEERQGLVNRVQETL